MLFLSKDSLFEIRLRTFRYFTATLVGVSNSIVSTIWGFLRCEWSLPHTTKMRLTWLQIDFSFFLTKPVDVVQQWVFDWYRSKCPLHPSRFRVIADYRKRFRTLRFGFSSTFPVVHTSHLSIRCWSVQFEISEIFSIFPFSLCDRPKLTATTTTIFLPPFSFVKSIRYRTVCVSFHMLDRFALSTFTEPYTDFCSLSISIILTSPVVSTAGPYPFYYFRNSGLVARH